MYLGEEDFAEARIYIERARRIWSAGDGPQSQAVGLCLDDLGTVERMTGDHRAARRDYEAALAIWTKTDGPESLPVARVLANLSALATGAGGCAVAESLDQHVLAIRQRELGSTDPSVAAAMRDLSLADLGRGRFSAAVEAGLAADAIGREQLRLAARALPENRALAIERTRGSGRDALVSAALQSSPGDARRTYDAVIRSRALVLDEIAARPRSVWAAGDTA